MRIYQLVIGVLVASSLFVIGAKAEGPRAVVFIEPKPGQAKALLDLTRKLLADVRKANPGLLKVEVNTVETDPDQIVLYYVWASKDAQTAYEASPLYKVIIDQLTPLVANRKLTRANNIE